MVCCAASEKYERVKESQFARLCNVAYSQTDIGMFALPRVRTGIGEESLIDAKNQRINNVVFSDIGG